MRSYLINKNLCILYKLQKLVGKRAATRICKAIERIILAFGREERKNGADHNHK